MSAIEISSFLNRLVYMLLVEVDSLQEVEDQLWLLHGILTRLMSIVLEGERKQSEDLMEHRGKVMEVIILVHQAEDITDSYLNIVRKGNHSHSVIDEANKFRGQIKGMVESLNELHAWFHGLTESNTCATSSSSSPTNEEVVLKKGEVKRMIDLLLKKDENQDDRREVIPVVGPEGIGKTAFVRKVYNDQIIVEHFPCRLWINVGRYYKVEELLLDIMKQMINPTTTTIAEAAATGNNGDEIIMRKETKKKQLKYLAIEIYKHLKTTTRYLIVFYDVCETQLWADINLVFPANNKCGSRIIFTARYDEVASHMRPSKPPFYLQRLSKEESWALFSKKRVNRFVDSKPNYDSHSELNTCPQELVDACCGLPLAIVALAAEDHRRCLTSVTTTTTSNDESKSWWSDRILPMGICELIYNALPYHLKMCLTYYHVLKEEEGGYPFLDYKGLIVAEGLVKPQPPPPPSAKLQKEVHQTSSSSSSSSAIARVGVVLEDIAEEYLTELINMNIIKVQSRSLDGRIKKIAISEAYYSLSDLCRSEGSVADSTKMKKLEEVRSLFIMNYSASTTMQSDDLQRIFQDSISLRVLVLVLVNINSYPPANNLIHLRYLHLKCRKKLYENPRDLTTCLVNLWNLQFLKLEFYGYKMNQPLPLQFWKMRQLKLLSFRGATVDPLFTENEVFHGRTLKKNGYNLQTLEGLDPQFCAMDFLSMMLNLITLRLDGNLYGFDERLAHVFPLLVRLRKLRLDCYELVNPNYRLSTFPPNITHLTLRGACVRMPYLMQALQKLLNLRVLKLASDSYVGYRERNDYVLDFDDGFPQLKFLKFKCLYRMKEWKMSVGAMPSLQKVVLTLCDRLEGLPSAALVASPTLQELEVRRYKDGVMRDAKDIEERIGKDRLKHLFFSGTN